MSSSLSPDVISFCSGMGNAEVKAKAVGEEIWESCTHKEWQKVDELLGEYKGDKNFLKIAVNYRNVRSIPSPIPAWAAHASCSGQDHGTPLCSRFRKQGGPTEAHWSRSIQFYLEKQCEWPCEKRGRRLSAGLTLYALFPSERIYTCRFGEEIQLPGSGCVA